MNKLYLMLIMAVTTYLVRMIPFVAFRKKITNPFFRSLVYYMPYAILSAMTFPLIIYSTECIPAACGGLIIGILLGYLERSLIEISLSVSAVALIIWAIMK